MFARCSEVDRGSYIVRARQNESIHVDADVARPDTLLHFSQVQCLVILIRPSDPIFDLNKDDHLAARAEPLFELPPVDFDVDRSRQPLKNGELRLGDLNGPIQPRRFVLREPVVKRDLLKCRIETLRTATNRCRKKQDSFIEHSNTPLLIDLPRRRLLDSPLYR